MRPLRFARNCAAVRPATFAERTRKGRKRSSPKRIALSDSRGGGVFPVILVGDVSQVYPRVPHLVDRAVAKANPLVGIGIVWIRPRVVVPRRDPDHGSFGKN